VRRALPWLLVGLVAVGAGLGMGIGIAGQSPSAQAQIAQIVRTTDNAGTARFTLSAVVIDPGRIRTEIVASGEMNFKTDSVSMTLQYPSADPHTNKAGASALFEVRMIETGGYQYVYLPSVSASGSSGTTTGPITHSWQKVPLSSGSRNGSGIVNSPMGLLGLPGSTQVLQDLGPSMVGGKEATEYEMGPSTCQSTANGLTQSYSSAPTTLWVDGHGRLIQGEATQTEVVQPPKASEVGRTTFRSTDTETVRLFDFGTPESITAPLKATVESGTEATQSGCS
jgi:hypothetical protein